MQIHITVTTMVTDLEMVVAIMHLATTITTVVVGTVGKTWVQALSQSAVPQLKMDLAQVGCAKVA